MKKPIAAISLALALSPIAHGAEFINVLTGGTSGVYYPVGVAMSQLYGKAMPDAKVSVQATKASAENLNLLQAGRGEIAFSLADAAADAWKGDAEAGFAQPLKKLRAVASIYPNYIQIVASSESGVKTLADLKGKRISVGGRPELQGLCQGGVPAVWRVGRADEKPPAGRHAAIVRPGGGIHP